MCWLSQSGKKNRAAASRMSSYFPIITSKWEKAYNRKAHTVTGHWMTFSSNRTLTIRNTTYSINIIKPRILFIFHLQAPIERMTKMSIMNSRTIAQNRPLLRTMIGLKLLEKAFRSHGRGNLRKDEGEQISEAACQTLTSSINKSELHS